jgi:hypothetical protein
MTFFDNYVIIFWSKISKEKELPEYIGEYNSIVVGNVFLQSVEKVRIDRKVQAKENWVWVYHSLNSMYSLSKGFLCVYRATKDKHVDTSIQAKNVIQNMLEREIGTKKA